MSFDSYKSLISEGIAANKPATPAQSDLRQFYFCTDTGDLYMWSPTNVAWEFTQATQSSIAAAGTTVGAATAITTRRVVVSTATVSTHGVILPGAATGLAVTVINKGPTFSLRVYPATGDNINAQATNSVDSTKLAAYKTTTYRAYDAQHWVTERGA